MGFQNVILYVHILNERLNIYQKYNKDNQIPLLWYLTEELLNRLQLKNVKYVGVF